MTKRFGQRRGELIARAVEQRAALARQIQDWQRPLEFADRAWNVVRYFKSRPLLMALPIGLFAFRRPRVLLRWFNLGWLAKAVLRKLFIR